MNRISVHALERDDVVGKNVYELMEKKIVPNSCSAKVWTYVNSLDIKKWS